jgi:hypothetical protein
VGVPQTIAGEAMIAFLIGVNSFVFNQRKPVRALVVFPALFTAVNIPWLLRVSWFFDQPPPSYGVAAASAGLGAVALLAVGLALALTRKATTVEVSTGDPTEAEADSAPKSPDTSELPGAKQKEENPPTKECEGDIAAEPGHSGPNILTGLRPMRGTSPPEPRAIQAIARGSGPHPSTSQKRVFRSGPAKTRCATLRLWRQTA